ncbi:Hypothetical protein PHPALM_36189 [Phytophthora palmivora]|uniref:Uncharacterized protein n=1 Tax=Phytophthora palmivora TaxID=4796 RepID=A0A2P4X0K4_9STRA|nr:Hypothetical protein PHPALM_36189 [Phytophthora palmivora]
MRVSLPFLTIELGRNGKRWVCVADKNARKRRRLTRAHDSVDSPQAITSSAAEFKYAWEKLRKDGWTSKPPSGRSLDNRYRYVRPGGNLRGKEGTDFLIGEVSVITFIQDHQLIQPLNNFLMLSEQGRGRLDVSSASDNGQTPLVTPRSSPTLLYDMYINTLVAISPAKEPWMIKTAYQPEGTTYIVGRVGRRTKKCKDKLQVQWIERKFQNCVENLSFGLI